MRLLRHRSPLSALLIAVLALLAVAAPVAADAELEATFPQAGATVVSPAEIAARFNEALQPDSRIEVLGPDGEIVASGGLDPEDPTRLLAVVDDPLEPGAYTVRMTVLSADDHLIRPTFEFSVAAPTDPPATPEPSASATAEPTEAPAASPTAEPTDAPAPSASPAPADPADATAGDALVPIIAALVVVGVLGVILLRGRSGRRA